jgi:hypothetical protein
MAEYGRIVGQGTGVGGRSGGSGDLTGQIMAAVGDIVERIASQPPEILLGVAAVVIIGGWLLMRR